MIRAVVKHGNQTFRYTLKPQSSVADLAELVAESTESAIEELRLIANGRELELKESLSLLGEFWFISNAIHLRFVDHEACREWQKTGRCARGRLCPHAASHTMQHSPRYVAHQEPKVCPPASSPPSSAEHSPHESPRVSPPSSPPHPEQDMHTPEGLVVCRHWRKGSCKFGDRCHWASTHKPEYLPNHLVADDHTSCPSCEEDSAHWTPTQQTVLLSGPDTSPTLPSNSAQQLENPNPWHSIGQYNMNTSAPLHAPQYYESQYVPQMYTNYMTPYGFNQQYLDESHQWTTAGVMTHPHYEPHYDYQRTSMVMS